MDTVYLTTEQIEALYKLTRGKKNRPVVGCQLRTDARDDTAVIVDCVRSDRPNDLAFASIAPDGTTFGWEY